MTKRRLTRNDPLIEYLHLPILPPSTWEATDYTCFASLPPTGIHGVLEWPCSLTLTSIVLFLSHYVHGIGSGRIYPLAFSCLPTRTQVHVFLSCGGPFLLSCRSLRAEWCLSSAMSLVFCDLRRDNHLHSLCTCMYYFLSARRGRCTYLLLLLFR